MFLGKMEKAPQHRSPMMAFRKDIPLPFCCMGKGNQIQVNVLWKILKRETKNLV